VKEKKNKMKRDRDGEKYDGREKKFSTFMGNK
jgi:hypothetical protein